LNLPRISSTIWSVYQSIVVRSESQAEYAE
jgi:hypothetical protein